MEKGGRQLTVVVCTYNRSDILKYCLDSLQDQSMINLVFEVLIVDNNSTDDTKKVAAEYCGKNKNFRYIFEEKQGLSHARNRGWKDSGADWVCYIDDDSYTGQNFFEEIFKTIEKDQFDMFGGVYLPWYKYGKPKWYKDEYVSNYKKIHDEGFLYGNEFVDGGIMVVKRKVIEETGGFSTDLGMKGYQIGYGEETEFQVRLRKKGKIIGFNPGITIYHLVPEYKLNLWWFLRSNFYNGRQSIVHPSGGKVSDKSLKTEMNAVEKRNCSWQNYAVKILSLLAYNFGRKTAFIGKKL